MGHVGWASSEVPGLRSPVSLARYSFLFHTAFPCGTPWIHTSPCGPYLFLLDLWILHLSPADIVKPCIATLTVHP